MDLVGEIVEHESSAPVEAVAPGPSPLSAFARRKPSDWKSRFRKQGLTSMSGAVKAKEGSKSEPTPDDYGLSESDLNANLERVKHMSQQEKDETMESLFQSFSPDTLAALSKRAAMRKEIPKSQLTEDNFELPPEIEARNEKFLKSITIEGNGSWIGGGQNGETADDLDSKYKDTETGSIAKTVLDSPGLRPVLKTPSSSVSVNSCSSGKKVRFNTEAYVKYDDNDKKPEEDADEWEDIADVKSFEEDEENNRNDDEAPEFAEVQDLLVSNDPGVHFPKPRQTDDELDINDPLFNSKLKEKYFPDLAANPMALDWMKPLPETPKEIIYDSVSDLRFDFEGKIVSNDMLDLPTHLGLHHHADKAELPGYTLAELERYARSTVNGQRCIAIRTLGRILFKLGKGTYAEVLVPEYGQDEEEDEAENPVSEITQRFWRLIKELRLVESLNFAADEQHTKNVSVRNYAIEALWLWKQGGGDPSEQTDETVKIEQ
ncbi:unnamed protein product [Kuraishia capsulata CBS 1993]|uniref:RPAP1 C-terminal domain-containing protein n=1 Tax=Kuraishia capsulata CBS 1993 TaxID=1382522 RepID=W6MPI1_9ASCO|nr:uncharacterized protein KUCA_T00002989001 [Kuraishia capsulata CBS 1993]CDK27012.1 unnamed protein product [Kuraishia capsulata CBS 1993]